MPRDMPGRRGSRSASALGPTQWRWRWRTMGWGSTPVKDRAQGLFRMKALMEGQTDRLAATIMEENGKTREEALGSILRAIECLEFASSLPQLIITARSSGSRFNAFVKHSDAS